MEFFNTLLFQPLFNLLIFTYNIIPDIGVAIILVTLLIKIILNPLYKKQLKAQKELQDMQPLLQDLKEKHKDDKEAFARESMEIYKEHNVNPFSSCLPLLIQLPILIAVYIVFRNGLTDQSLDQLYPFIANPETINPMFLGLVDLSKNNIILALLAGVAQFFQARTLVKTRPKPKTDGSKDEDTLAVMNKQMMYMMPIITVFIGASLPGGLALYWLVTTSFMVMQQYIYFKKDNMLVSDTQK